MRSRTGLFILGALALLVPSAWIMIAAVGSPAPVFPPGSSATLLPDGRMFIAGGAGAGGPVAAAEILSNGSVTSAAAMSIARSRAGAIALADGRVLVTGGITTGGAILNSAEIYDGATNSWSAIPSSLIEPRAGHTASLLRDGRVVLAGGETDGRISQGVEVFDPSTGEFSFGGTLSMPRAGHAAAVLADGRVLIAGGSFGGVAPSASTDIFDPATGTISAGPELLTGRSGHTATTLLSGKVLIVGGTDGLTDLDSAEIFDAVTGTIQPSSSLHSARSGHSAYLLSSGDVLILGGDVGAAELYSFKTGTLSDASRNRPTPITEAPKTAREKIGAPTVSADTATATATISTDKTKYFVGAPMTITGLGFTAGSIVNIWVLRPDHVTDSLSATTNDSGTFSAVYTPLAIPGRYKITATDGSNSANTAVTEADAIKVDFFQCANKNPTLGTCDWISSILQQGKSLIFEGMSTLQRLTFDLVPGTTGNVHVLKFHVDATKSGSHAYDFITTWDAARAATNAINSGNPPDSLYPILDRSAAGTAKACNNPSNPQAALQAVCQALHISTNPNAVFATMSTAFTNASVGGSVSVQNAFTNYQTAFSSGNTQVVALFGNSSFSGTATLSFDGYDSAAGDQNARYTLTWTSASTQMEIEFGAHVAQGVDTLGLNIGYGANLGAANINGGPYHVSIDSFDGASLGSQDNQLQGSDIRFPPRNPTITTEVRDAANANITNQKVEVGTVVHDHATISSPAATNLIPAGSTVTFHRYPSNNCTGTPVDQTGVVVPSGVQTAQVDSATFTTTPGSFSYLVDFISGNTTVLFNRSGDRATTDCEPFTVIAPATTLTLKSQTPSGSSVEAGTSVTIVVTETNTGNDPLHDVSVTAGGVCTTSGFTGGANTLAVGASTDFTCTFTAGTGANAWTADGQGKDSLNNPVPTTNEHAAGSVNGISAATTLTLKSQTPSGSVEAGTSVTIVVTETNTGTDPLHDVSVTAGGVCTTSGFTGGATTLAVGASTDLTCTFTAGTGANVWTADGQAKDSLNNPVPATNEHAAGSVNGISAATTLTLKSQTPSGSVEAGTSVTIVVTETNTGNDPLHDVSVTAGGVCTTSGFTGGATTLAVGGSTDFTCTFTAGAGANAWTADGKGKDSLNNPVPATNEHAAGSVNGIRAATTLTLKSQTPSGSSVEVGTLVTIVVTETNTGNDPLHAVSVTGGVVCTSGFTGGANTLAAGASTDFSCTFTAGLGPNGWTADGQGLDSLNNAAPPTNEHAAGSVTGITNFIRINKLSKGGVHIFTFESSGSGFTVPPITTQPIDVLGNGAGTTGNIQVHTGTYSVGESNPPTGWKLDASDCQVNQGLANLVPTNVGGVNVGWQIVIIQPGATVECTFDNSTVPGTTRTQGFWATHTGLSNTIWNTLVPDVDKTLCTTVITATTAAGTNQLMGGFWSGVSKKSDKTSRPTLDQVRMQVLQQYLAAVLNVANFNSNTEDFLKNARDTYCGTNVSAIQGLIGTLGSFNSSGDSGLFTPGVSATAQTSKSQANVKFWDTTTH